jgi:hypothetical protein
MRCLILCVAAALLALPATVEADTISFSTDPFAGTTALTTPGRQIIGNELFTPFSPALDVFSFDVNTFGISSIHFANNTVGNLPTSGVNVIVLRTFDNDNDPTTPFNAGTAANLIAAQITSPGAGFFIYFNSALDLPRLVFSTDLNDNTADLKVLARMTNLTGPSGRDQLANFTAANFAIQTPEPASALLLISSSAFWACCHALRRRRLRD